MKGRKEKCSVCGEPSHFGTCVTRKQIAVNPTKPELTLLVKLGSIAVHVEEMLSPKGHAFDKTAIESLLSDKEVQQWIKYMGAYLPVKRG